MMINLQRENRDLSKSRWNWTAEIVVSEITVQYNKFLLQTLADCDAFVDNVYELNEIKKKRE